MKWLGSKNTEGNSVKQQHGDEPDQIPDFLLGVMETLKLRQEAVKKIRSCPGVRHCDKGIIPVQVGAVQERLRCPLLSVECDWGRKLVVRLNHELKDTLTKAGVPALHMDRILDDTYHRNANLRRIDKWKGRGIMTLTGGVGVGKSFGAALAAWNWAWHKFESLWKDRTGWLGQLNYVKRSVEWCYSTDLVSNKEYFNRVRGCHFMIVDDLGMEHNSDWSRSVINDLINQRYHSQRATVITTNLGLVEIEQRYTPRVSDRIMEGGTVVAFTGESMREGE
jgi:hypothetical protein